MAIESDKILYLIKTWLTAVMMLEPLFYSCRELNPASSPREKDPDAR